MSSLSPKSTYLFYDIETSGLNKCFDQILQFAAIRTDLALNELSRHEINIALQPDIIPSPGAMITHRLPIAQLTQGESALTAVEKIHALLNTPATISLGYNTLKFDDEFLRFTFYRHLLSPYTHQYANGCARFDILPMLVMFYLFKPEALKWPTPDSEEKLSLQLSTIGEINQVLHGPAHHAMSDVCTTLELARLLFQHQTIWKYLCGYFGKSEDQIRMQPMIKSPNNQPPTHFYLLVDHVFGHRDRFLAPVVYLGNHRFYKNQTIWLKIDDERLTECKPSNIDSIPWVIRKKYGETPFILPAKPRYQQHLNERRQRIIQKHLDFLSNHPTLWRTIADYYCHYQYPKIDHLDPAASLYQNGFPSTQEQTLLQQFNTTPLEQKARILEHFDQRQRHYRNLGIRLLGHHRPDLLTPEQQSEYYHYLQQCAAPTNTLGNVDYQGKSRLTPNRALQEIAQLKDTQTLDVEQVDILRKLEVYLKRHFFKCTN